MQIGDRAFAADRAVIGVLWRDAEAASEQLFRIAVAPAQEIDDVERLDVAEQVAAAVRFGALQRGFQQRERLEAIGDFFRTIGDFADADDDGNAVFGYGGGWVRHFLVSPSCTINALQRRLLRHCEPTGRRKAPPDDRLREAIHRATKQVWIALSLRSSQ